MSSTVVFRILLFSVLFAVYPVLFTRRVGTAEPTKKGPIMMRIGRWWTMVTAEARALAQQETGDVSGWVLVALTAAGLLVASQTAYPVSRGCLQHIER